MIKKASSSEVFDAYALRMISKRATLAKFLSDIFPQLERIGSTALDNAKLTSAVSRFPSKAINDGVKSLSVSDAPELKKLFQDLHHASALKEGETKIIDLANLHGYSGFSKADDFLEQYAIDFEKMTDDFATKFGGPAASYTDADIVDFMTTHKKTIGVYNDIKLKERGPLGAIFKSDVVDAGKWARDNGRVGDTFQDIQSGMKGTSKFEKGKLIGLGLGFVLQLIPAGVGLYYGNEVIEWAKSLTGKEATDEFKNSMEAAIECINAIPVIGAAAAERDLIIKNLESAGKVATSLDTDNPEEVRKILYEYSSAIEQLGGSGSGSVANFIALISKDPGENIEGYFAGNKMTSSLGGAAGGAAIGALFGRTLVGAAIMGVIGGLAGWYFLGSYYEEEITCLSNAVAEAKKYDEELTAGIKKVQDDIKASGGSSTTTGEDSKTRSGERGQSTGSEFSSDNISIVQRILEAGAGEKLTGFSGLDLAIEVKVVRSFVNACEGSQNAARTILERNPSITRYIDQLRQAAPALLSSPINDNFQKNKSAESLIQVIYDSIRVLHKSVIKGNKTLGIINPGEQQLTSLMRAWLEKDGFIFNKSSKNNWNKMSKTSKSINNQEFIRKAAETRVSYFGDADSGLKDQLTKSYYAGLTGMYNEKPQKRPSDYDKFYGVQKETGPDLVLQSHPKSITLADAMGKGGLVENGLEQKEKSTYVALNTPTGNFQSKYASTIGYLTKLAKAADEQGKKEVSKLIRQTIQNLK
jgi:hypothetical protein